MKNVVVKHWRGWGIKIKKQETFLKGRIDERREVVHRLNLEQVWNAVKTCLVCKKLDRVQKE